MTKRVLQQVSPRDEGLGVPTIMSRTLAGKWGVPYVHIAALAIDLDRVVRHQDELQSSVLPEAFEVALLVRGIEEVALADGVAEAMWEDICIDVFDGDPERLGGQITFAIWVASELGLLTPMLDVFSVWKKKPMPLLNDVRALRPSACTLAKQVLDVALQPGLAPPTRERLANWAASDP